MMPKIRLQDAVSALPVPLCGVGNNSGVYEYNTAYMTLLQKLYAQLYPRSALDESAVVEMKRNTPVSAVNSERVPLRPILGN